MNIYNLLNIYRKTKLKYKNEVMNGFIDKLGFVFCLLISMFLFYSCYMGIIEGYLYNKYENLKYIIFELPCAVILLIYLIRSLSNIIKYRIKYKNIIKYGKCYDACITNVEYKIHTKYYGTINDASPKTVEDFKVIGTYIENNKKREFISENLAFNPIKYLGSLNCKVYIKDNDMYVNGFILKKSNNDNPWKNINSIEKILEKKKRNFNKTENKISRILIFIFIIVVLLLIIQALYLNNLNY